MDGRGVQTIRQPSFTSLFVDSMDRYANGFPYDTTELTTSSQWTLQSRQYVLNGYFNRIALTQVQFFWNLPTIITGYNDTIAIGNASGTALVGYITIPQHWYICDSLATAIQVGFSALLPSGTVTADPHSGALTFTAPDGFSILPPNSAYVSGDPVLYGRTYQTTGIIPGHSANTLIGGFMLTPHSLTCGIPTMLPTRYIDIGSKYLTKNQRVKDSSTLISGQISNILARVYAFAPSTRTPFPPSTNSGSDVDTPVAISIDYGNGKQLEWLDDEIISNFDIILTDEYGGLVPWDKAYGCEYAFTLTASET